MVATEDSLRSHRRETCNRDILAPAASPNIARGSDDERRKKLAHLAVIPTAALMLSVNTLSAIAAPPSDHGPTATPIKHLIVLFQENVSFDHYLGTYPNALNAPGEQPFNAYPGTPSVNGFPPSLLTQNQNVSTLGVQVNPQRLSPAQAYTCSQSHNYTPEQTAVDSGLLDNFPAGTGRTTSEGCAAGWLHRARLLRRQHRGCDLALRPKLRDE